jgi:hypothetical protein
MIALHEEASEDWVPVKNAPMTSLVGGPVMSVGNLLWLDDGKRKLVGDVNSLFGTNGHCPSPSIPVVRAYRRLVDPERLKSVSPETWATAFDLDEDIFDFVEEHEYPEVARVAMPANTVGELDWSGALKPGMVVEMEDGRRILVGHVNVLAGVCDSSRMGEEQRIVRYYKPIPDAVFATKSYCP